MDVLIVLLVMIVAVALIVYGFYLVKDSDEDAAAELHDYNTTPTSVRVKQVGE